MHRIAEVSAGIYSIDTKMGGLERVTAAYLIDGIEPALVETGPARSAHEVIESLSQLGIGSNDLAHVLLTHIHLDHAGGAGDLASAFPAAKIWVHERGASHLADPKRLVAGAERVYGRHRVQELFGATRPVPAQAIHTAASGFRLDLGGRAIEFLHTPGHASHHVAYAESETGAVFTGDAVGVHLPGQAALRPAAPPPEFDLGLALASIDSIRERAGGALLFSHFGPASDVSAVCELAKDKLIEAADRVRLALQRTEDIDEIAAELRSLNEASERTLTHEDLAAFEISGDSRINAQGLARYWKKRSEAEAHPPEGSL